MKVSDILTLEGENADLIYLLKEGIFWRAYEKSAWRFVKNIREYQVFRKYVKAVKQDICYLGFPESSLDDIMQKAEQNGYIVKKSETKIIITNFPESVGFEQWKAEIVLAISKEKINGSKEDEIIRKIKEYSIINKTQVEAVNFLAELQKQLYGSV